MRGLDFMVSKAGLLDLKNDLDAINQVVGNGAAGINPVKKSLLFLSRHVCINIDPHTNVRKASPAFLGFPQQKGGIIIPFNADVKPIQFDPLLVGDDGRNGSKTSRKGKQ